MASNKNSLYYGDNLEIPRRYLGDESVDLVYLDPPFKSGEDYNILFEEHDGTRSKAQVMVFEDTWSWDQESEVAYREITTNGPEKVAQVIEAFRTFLGSSDMMAYLVMMAPRLVELRRVLKPTGSIYLHCDSSASHYLKLLMDAIFGPKNFQGEIIWRRTAYNKSNKRYGPIHQTILFYTKSDQSYYVPQMGPYTKEYVQEYFKQNDNRGKYQSVSLTGPSVRKGDSGKKWRGYDPTDVGRHWQPASYVYQKYQNLTGDDLAKYPLLERLDKLDEVGLIHWGKKKSVPRYKYYLADAPGVPLQDIWAFQPGTKGCIYKDENIGIDQDVKWLSTGDKERLGYPTQKPEGLLERIIKSSCPENGIVLDPFCGCGTTVSVAQRLGRNWIGIDITYLAITLIKHRLRDTFKQEVSYQVIGEPVCLSDAKELAKQDRYQFQWWALGLVQARPTEEKKGADRGVDGQIKFFDDIYNKAKKIIIQVKSGHCGSNHIRDLRGVVEREKAAMGVYITLEEPTTQMKKEAVAAGFYQTPSGDKQYFPRIQILTIEELLAGKTINYPIGTILQPFKKAKAKPGEKIEELELGF